MTHCIMGARSQGKLYTQREMARRVVCAVRKWLRRRLNGFHCDLQAGHTPLLPDEAVSVNARDAVKALIKATRLSPRMSVCGWPFSLDDLDDAGGVR